MPMENDGGIFQTMPMVDDGDFFGWCRWQTMPMEADAAGAAGPGGPSPKRARTSSDASSATEPDQTEQAEGPVELEFEDVVLVQLPDGTRMEGTMESQQPDAEGFYDIMMIPSGDIKKFKRGHILKLVRKAALV